MKRTNKLLSLLLALLLCLSLVGGFGSTTLAVTQIEGDFEFEVTNGAATITGYNGSATDLTIPSTLGGYPVTSIGDNAFLYCPVTFHCNLVSYAAVYAEDNNIHVEEIVRILGDANGSGSVDSADASQILRWVVKLIKNDAIDLTAANVTGGSTVSSADASKILRWIVRLESTLSPN